MNDDEQRIERNARRRSGLLTAEVIPRLPHFRGPDWGDALPDQLEGAVIIHFGTLGKEVGVETGGLVIDYRKPDTDKVYRLVLAFNDVAMWSAIDNECGFSADSAHGPVEIPSLSGWVEHFNKTPA